MRTLSIKDLVAEYVAEGYRVRPFEQLSAEAGEGEIVLLLGPSGSGKTTLLSCLAGILTPASGSIRVAGREVTSLDQDALARYRRETVGIVFQAFNLIPSLTARENVAAPLLIGGTKRRAAMARADELLAVVGLTDRASHRPGKLSGGQQQRVAIARALAHDPWLLLADEPTANLDYINAEAIIRLLRTLRSEGRLIVISSHDDRIVPIADRVINMAPDAHDASGPQHAVTFARGESIFEQGDRATHVYVIQKGKVDIVRILADGSEERLARIGPGEYFGELGPLLGFPRSASARANTKAELVAMGPADFRERMQGLDEDQAQPDA